MRAAKRLAWGVLTAVAIGTTGRAQQDVDGRALQRAEQTLRREGQAVLDLADAATDGRQLPADFTLDWHNDFLKAQPGTFVPFVVRIAAPEPAVTAALMYVRVARRGPRDATDRRTARRIQTPAASPEYPFEEIYPIALTPGKGHVTAVARGFSVAPGDYDVTVVVRERAREDERGRRRAAVLRRTLAVPDFAAGQLTTSTVIVADRLTDLPDGVAAGELRERPYVIGRREIQPAADSRFGPDEELIVVFLIYDPAVTAERRFDLEVDYRFYRKHGSREAYVNRTEPQRFNPDVLGPQFDPSAGQPVMAGQGVPLGGFQAGDYRLAITVKDLVSGRSVGREVRFSVER